MCQRAFLRVVDFFAAFFLAAGFLVALFFTAFFLATFFFAAGFFFAAFFAAGFFLAAFFFRAAFSFTGGASPWDGGDVLVAVTEKRSAEDVDRYVSALREIVGAAG